MDLTLLQLQEIILKLSAYINYNLSLEWYTQNIKYFSEIGESVIFYLWVFAESFNRVLNSVQVTHNIR